jgi:4-aminobutyrate aminotransferase-like enzyme
VRIGALMTEGLRALAARFPAIGDVRGAGLYLGVEMILPDGSPDAAAAARIVNDLRARRVLISATGPAANVLKIRPPLVFSAADTDRLLTETEAVLAAIYG